MIMDAIGCMVPLPPGVADALVEKWNEEDKFEDAVDNFKKAIARKIAKAKR